MDKIEEDVKLGRKLSFILRHHPESVGLTLDENGWVEVNKLIINMKIAGSKINKEILERIVVENNKKRYSFNEDKSKIRANQGHSINVDVELKESVPLDILYHGTADRFIKSIKNKGLLKMDRLYVHLSSDEKTAINVGKRHGKVIVLSINARKMHEKGFKFYLSENEVWLCDNIPVEYINFS